MAFEIPPWLSYTPQTFLGAAQTGGQLGLGMAQNTLRARETATDAAMKLAQMNLQRDLANQENARRSWEFEQNLRDRAAQNAAEREMAAARLAETQRYHLAGQDIDLARMAQTEDYNAARLGLMEEGLDIRKAAANKPKEPILRTVGGTLYRIDPDDPSKTTVLIPGTEKLRYASPAEMMELTNNPLLVGNIITNYGQDWFNRAREFGKTALPGFGAGSQQPIFGTSPDGSTAWYAPDGTLLKVISNATNLPPSPVKGPPRL